MKYRITSECEFNTNEPLSEERLKRARHIMNVAIRMATRTLVEPGVPCGYATITSARQVFSGQADDAKSDRFFGMRVVARDDVPDDMIALVGHDGSVVCTAINLDKTRS